MRLVPIFLCAAFCIAQSYGKEINSVTADSTVKDADTLLSNIKAAEQRYADLMARQNTLNADLDSYWLIINAALVLLMQAGLALYEAGTVRPNNQSSVFFKNVLTCAVVAITWWTVGYALAYGDNRKSSTRNGFIGNGAFILVSDGTSAMPERDYGRWFFEWTYALIPTTIVTMALAERLKTSGIIFISFVMSGFVYPVIAHWTWSRAGWLSPFAEEIGRMGDQGFFDYAGSGTIFLCGGAAGLAATLAVGARVQRFQDAHAAAFGARNKLFLTFGALLLWFTAFAYTTGRTLHLSGPAASSGASVASKITITTTLGAVGGFLGGFPLYYFQTSADRLNMSVFTDSVLAGIASIAAGVALVEPWAALTIGFIGGIFYTLTRGLLERLEVDDSLNGFSIFSVPAFWGLVAVGLLATEYNTLNAYPQFQKGSVKYGLFYHGGGDMLWEQLVGSIAILAWSFGATFIIVKVAGSMAPYLIRLDSEDEKFGADLSHYTEFAVAESFADDCDSWKAKLAAGSSGAGCVTCGTQDVPRWQLVDHRCPQQQTKGKDQK
jgi:Amt family ammonium transporter